MAKDDIQIPGQPKTDGGKDTPPVDPVKPAEQVTVSAEMLAQMQARIEELSRQIQDAQPRKRFNPEDSLPNAEDIDQSTLKAPVLTRSGWLVPVTFGANASAPKA